MLVSFASPTVSKQSAYATTYHTPLASGSGRVSAVLSDAVPIGGRPPETTQVVSGTSVPNTTALSVSKR